MVKQYQNPTKKVRSIIVYSRFLARQGLPLQGDWVEKENGEVNSNFNQLLLLTSIDDPNFKDWTSKKQLKYTSPTIQNELLQIFANTIPRQIADSIKGNLFATMNDELARNSNKEQL